eukprot:322678_1
MKCLTALIATASICMVKSTPAAPVISAAAGSVIATSNVWNIINGQLVDAGIKIVVSNYLCVDLDYADEHIGDGTAINYGADVRSGTTDGISVQESNWSIRGVSGLVQYEIGDTGYFLNIFYRVFNFGWENNSYVWITYGDGGGPYQQWSLVRVSFQPYLATTGQYFVTNSGANVRVEASLGNSAIATMRVDVQPIDNGGGRTCQQVGYYFGALPDEGNPIEDESITNAHPLSHKIIVEVILCIVLLLILLLQCVYHMSVCKRYKASY